MTAIADPVEGRELWPGSRASSFFSTGSKAYVSKDGRTTFAEIYPAGNQQFAPSTQISETRAAIKAATPGDDVYLTGRDPLFRTSAGPRGPSLLVEILIGGLGAMLVLLFVFGTLPAVAIPLVVAACSILTTFSLVWAPTYVTDVSIIVQFLVALVGLGVAIDYSLLMVFRFREELHHGRRRRGGARRDDDACGPLGRRLRLDRGDRPAEHGAAAAPFIRSIGIGGMLIPAVSVVGAITLVPALLAMLGHVSTPARDAEADRRPPTRARPASGTAGPARGAPTAARS